MSIRRRFFPLIACTALGAASLSLPSSCRATSAAAPAAESGTWVAFDPPADRFSSSSAIDLRYLNEKRAGDDGFIAVKDGRFVHSRTGEPVRFWAANGCPGTNADELRHAARVLAKYGVNLVRLHGGMFDQDGNVDPEKVWHAQEAVEALKAQGIYAHFSIYFPLWLSPKPSMAGLVGYDGHHHPFAALMFNKDFQERYRGWWKALLTTPDGHGHKLIDEPAVFGAEIQNEDSYFFWTFNAKEIPEAQLRIIEGQFGQWLAKKYGSIDAALKQWGGAPNPRDNPGQGLVGFRGHWEMANQRTSRDRDTVAFLAHSQREFYQQTYQFLRSLGFKGLICASNWATADPRVLGPIEKYTYMAGDFVDRHGYFSGAVRGDNHEWSIRAAHEYADRDALKFDPEVPGIPKSFVNSIMDVHYGGKPSMISEIAMNRPNRFRSEAPLYYACYGALQDSNCIVHFAFDSDHWSTKPGYFMQPWTMMSPATVGQFPAAALVYRKVLVGAGDVVVDLNLKVAELMELQGTPLPQDAAFDELRLKDVPAAGAAIKPGNVIDPLVHYVGRARVNLDGSGASSLTDVSKFIDRGHQTVTSTNGQLKLDYGHGVLRINAPAAQGVSGNLKEAGAVELDDLSLASDMPLGHIVAVALDGRPLASSLKVLLQVMSEEKPSDWETIDVGNGIKRITQIGHDPWQIRAMSGTVKFKRGDAGKLKVTALDGNGEKEKGEAGTAAEIKLLPGTLYYLIAK
jgi:hypothetical protein